MSHFAPVSAKLGLQIWGTWRITLTLSECFSWNLSYMSLADAISSGQETKSIIEDEGLKRVMKYNATNEEYLKVKMDAIRDSRSVCW